jgi:S-adenosylmethionine synthetase
MVAQLQKQKPSKGKKLYTSRPHLFTSESVADGHPDKVADHISDAILDDIIAQDPDCRCAVETMVSTGMAIVAGEITTKAYCDFVQVVRNTVREIGYDDPSTGFDWQTIAVLSSIKPQSPDIAQGVNRKKRDDMGAGDQGLMFGFACDQTPSMMPAPIYYAHRITERLGDVRRKGLLDYLHPDGKSQVTIEYKEGKPARLDAVVVAAMHKDTVQHAKIKRDIIDEVILPCFPQGFADKKTKYFVNETGKFVIGGPRADTGLTGRKIIVDTYGGYGSHGGGAFSGKDPSKVDRTASYMARHVAKNVVAAGLAEECEVQLAYAIGVADPVSVLVETFGTSEIPEGAIEQAVIETFPLRPWKMIEYLDLRRPIFKKTAAYGHYGREDPDFTWEKTGAAAKLKKAAESYA